MTGADLIVGIDSGTSVIKAVAFDLTGSYDAMWMMSIALAIVAGIVHLPVVDRALRPLPA